ncbi:flagellar motor protein MotB [Sphingomonas aracearum]|uniref:Flagellar motor protein MotB n=2 Tax=Sphingomonas aracearum TaxID=2283317 RepID=A0A369VU22_9SPHN|nr:flagellar motor protein MotB [Sphingomonas aracearum]
MDMARFDEAPARPLWLITLADLALLLVGFFVLIQSRQLDRQALARGLRAGFGVSAPAPATREPMPLGIAAMLNFAPGSAALPSRPDGLVAWAEAALRDPRVLLTVTGSTDGSPSDVDPLTRSAAVLAADRARAIAVALAVAVPSHRLLVRTSGRPQGRRVSLSLGYAGVPERGHP